MELRKQFYLIVECALKASNLNRLFLVFVEIVAQMQHTFVISLASTVLCWNSFPANIRFMDHKKSSAKKNSINRIWLHLVCFGLIWNCCCTWTRSYKIVFCKFTYKNILSNSILRLPFQEKNFQYKQKIVAGEAVRKRWFCKNCTTTYGSVRNVEPGFLATFVLEELRLNPAEVPELNWILMSSWKSNYDGRKCQAAPCFRKRNQGGLVDGQKHAV